MKRFMHVPLLLGAFFTCMLRPLATPQDIIHYCTKHKHAHALLIWPLAHKNTPLIEPILKAYGTIIDKKEFRLTADQQLPFIKEVYKGEWTMGSIFDNFAGARHKRLRCFPFKPADKNIITLYIYQAPHRKTVIAAKQRVRKACNTGFNSIHSADSQQQTLRLLSIIFKNSDVFPA